MRIVKAEQRCISTPVCIATMAVFGFNQAEFIAEAVHSAFAQTLNRLEILLVDDASEDATLEIMNELAAAYRGPAQVRVIANPVNIGFAGSISRAMGEAKSDLLILAGGDDVALPERAAVLFSEWQDAGRPAVCLHSTAKCIASNGRDLNRQQGPWNPTALSNSVQMLRQGASLLGATVAVPRKNYEMFGPVDVTGIGNTEDVAFAFRSALLGGAIFIGKPLVRYRVGSGVSTQNPSHWEPTKWRREAARRLDQSLACTIQMERDLERSGLMTKRLEKLIGSRKWVLETSKASYLHRRKALWCAVRTLLYAIVHREIALRRVFMKSVWRIVSRCS